MSFIAGKSTPSVPSAISVSADNSVDGSVSQTDLKTVSVSRHALDQTAGGAVTTPSPEAIKYSRDEKRVIDEFESLLDLMNSKDAKEKGTFNGGLYGDAPQMAVEIQYSAFRKAPSAAFEILQNYSEKRDRMPILKEYDNKLVGYLQFVAIAQLSKR